MVPVAPWTGHEQLVEGNPPWTGCDQAATDRVVPGVSGKPKSGSTCRRAVALLVEGSDCGPVISPRAVLEDLEAKPMGVVCNGGPPQPEQPRRRRPAMAGFEQSLHFSSRDVRCSLWTTRCPIGPGRLRRPERGDVVAHRRTGDFQAVRNLVPSEALGKQRLNGRACGQHEHMFASEADARARRGLLSGLFFGSRCGVI